METAFPFSDMHTQQNYYHENINKYLGPDSLWPHMESVLTGPATVSDTAVSVSHFSSLISSIPFSAAFPDQVLP